VAQKIFDRTDEPTEMWTIEDHGRVMEERKRLRVAEAEVKLVLDHQKIEMARTRELSIELDKDFAVKMVKKDLEIMTHEA